MIVNVQLLFTTPVPQQAGVAPLLNQGTFRHRGVSDGGVFFGYFLDDLSRLGWKQKVTKKIVRSTKNVQSLLHPFLQPFNR